MFRIRNSNFRHHSFLEIHRYGLYLIPLVQCVVPGEVLMRITTFYKHRRLDGAKDPDDPGK